MRLLRAVIACAGALPARAQAPTGVPAQPQAQAQAAAPAATPAPADDPVQRGRYLATAADCMPCHTAQGGTPFAGGRALNTPFGSITSPNITPDPATGIGRWSAEQFWGALHDGLRAAAGLYLTYCAGCHQPLGIGVAGAIPPLAGNAAVLAAQPNNVIQAMLNGIPAQGNYGAMPMSGARLLSGFRSA